VAWLSERRPAWDGALLPVVVQDDRDGTVLMLAWANSESVAATESTGVAHFWSRSRGELWRKGATSGNELRVTGIAADCDADALLYRVIPSGPACHTGARSCFDDERPLPPASLGVLTELEATILERRAAAPEDSYTSRLLGGGPRRPAEKVVEEAGETAAAALAGTTEELAAEAADLIYHLLALLAARDVPLDNVLRVLRGRRRP
jgi:phosphoribosyl-AMP cyclohydrolase / phosphoribosyl-ATP pyrophosphohydrolase